jgi:hypothetical protein
MECPRLYITDQFIMFDEEPVAKIWEGADEIAVKKFEYYLQDLEELETDED